MKNRPLFVATLAFIAGIYLGRQIHFPFGVTLALSVVALIAFAFSFIKTKFGLRWCVGLTCALLLGILRITPIAFPNFPANHLLHWADKSKLSIEGVVATPPLYPDGEFEHMIVEATRIRFSANEWTSAEGKIQILIRNHTPALSSGDQISLETDIRHIINYRTPGAYDRAWFLGAEGIYVSGYVRDGSSIRILSPSRRAHFDLVQNSRMLIRRQADHWNTDDAFIVKALVLGEKQSIPKPVYQSFTDIGINHLLAISGLHITTLAGLVFFMIWFIGGYLGKLPLRVRLHRLAAFCALPFPIIYALLAGGSVSVVRACIMYLAFVFAVLLGRQRDLYTALALAALLILGYAPESLWSAGFQLSFAAVLAMIHLRGMVNDFASRRTLEEKLTDRQGWLLRFRRSLLRLAGFSLAAFLGTFTITAWHFGMMAPAGMIANLVAVPLFSLLVIPALLLGTFLLPLSTILAHALWMFGAVVFNQIYGIALFLESIGIDRLFIVRPTWPQIAAIIAILAAMPYWKRRIAKIALAFGLAILFLSPSILWLRDRMRDDLRFTMIDVQQGLSMLVESPGGKRMLFDGGGNPYSDTDIGHRVILPFLSARRISRLDIVVVSHPHPDHYRGLIAVVDAFDIGELWIIDSPILSPGSGDYLQMLARARVRNIPIKIMNTKTPPLELGKVAVSILNPPVSNTEGWNLNDLSMAVRLEYAGKVLLLCSDIERAAEERILQNGDNIAADVVQVAHHGSRSSSDDKFIKGSHPKFALISVGRYNIWHLPSPEIRQKWIESKAILMETGDVGAIECILSKTLVSCTPSINVLLRCE